MLDITQDENTDWLQYLHSFNLGIKYLYTYLILPVDLYVDYGFLMQNRADMSPWADWGLLIHIIEHFSE